MDRKTVTVRGVTLGDGLPKICVPITARGKEELKEQAERIRNTPCDMVEWRADYYEGIEREGTLTEALAFLRKTLGELPLLFTFRTGEEGGEKAIPMETYRHLNVEAAKSGLADLADLELNRGEELVKEITEKLHQEGVLVIGSFHDFEKTPPKEEITEILCRMQRLGADITKAAVMPRSEEDVLTLLEATLDMKKQYGDRPFITMSMGALGSVSRLSGALTGSALTFATAGRASAPGQMEAELLARLLPSMNF